MDATSPGPPPRRLPLRRLGVILAVWVVAAGGGPGRPGVNRVERRDGRIEELDHIGSVEMQPGDVFVIETPGGGGFGTPPAPSTFP